MEVIDAFSALRRYCEQEEYKGWDPYDGLNSRVFQSLPFLKRSALCRLIVIQGFKRCPVNFRPLAAVPKEYNAKGIGLFLQGYCHLWKVLEQHPELERDLGDKVSVLQKVHEVADLLLTLQSKGYSGACWGYNFDWQARRLFLFPKNTPTVVATTFCATALFDAYELTHDERYLNVALSSAEFVVNDLHRTACEDGGFLFSYSPLAGNDTVFNASLLGSKLLSLCYRYTGKPEYFDAARQKVEACCRAQREDGAWIYGLLPVQSWIDSFHTGYNLDALLAYEEQTGDFSYHEHLERGFRFYIEHFFEVDGSPKYYHDRKYPVDIHCPGQLFVTLHSLHRFHDCREVAARVLHWTVEHMQDKRGYFYYQLKPGISSRIPYMRWSNAFMFNALSCYLLVGCEESNELKSK